MLLPGSQGLACLLMTKGLFTVFPVASALGLSLLIEKRWDEILNIQWIWVILITLVFTMPSLAGYYIQFDLHPEKVIFGQSDFSGIRFFLWDSQWGRFTNTGPIKGEGNLFFYLHTMLWSFAPWAFLVYYGTNRKIHDLFRHKGENENYTFFGFIFVFFIFSISRFQLPHYLNQLFHLMANIVTAGLLKTSKSLYTLKTLYILQIITMPIFDIITVLLHFFFFSQIPRIDVMLILVTSWGFVIYILLHEGSMIKRIIIPPELFILSINYYLNRQFCPHLLPYQSESQVAFYIRENNLSADQLVFYEENEWVTDFYLKRIIPEYNRDNLKSSELKGKYVFTSEEGLKDLEQRNYDFETVKTFSDFHVTTLNGTFLNKKTRNTVLKKKWLIRIRG